MIFVIKGGDKVEIIKHNKEFCSPDCLKLNGIDTAISYHRFGRRTIRKDKKNSHCKLFAIDENFTLTRTDDNILFKETDRARKRIRCRSCLEQTKKIDNFTIDYDNLLRSTISK